ncbi:MAG: hypothetical protein H7A54_19740 [Akkermansiaceae bacterium]|nr:hypothetical protein [Akkermansiaceae bacterium]
MITLSQIIRGCRNWLRAFFSSGFVPVPVAGWEWFIIRTGFALLVWNEMSDFHPYAFEDQPASIGVATMLDLRWLHHPLTMPVFQWITAAGLICYIGGWFHLAVLPVLTLLHTLLRTYENSQGSIHHSHQMITVVLLVQTLVVWGFWFQARRSGPLPAGALASWHVYYVRAGVAATYVIAALSKLINSKGLWLWRSPYIAFDLVKAQRQKYYADLDPQYLGDTGVAEWVLASPHLARIGFSGGFFLELFALLAVRNRPWAFWIGLGLIAFHRGVYWLMHLRFHNNEAVLLLFFLNLPYWAWWLFQKSRGRLTPGLESAAENS